MEIDATTDKHREQREAQLLKLLAPVSEAAPGGTNVEYDPAYLKLERVAAGTPERQVGTSIIPAVDPDWEEVADLAGELALQSKDLRVLVQLCTAWLKTEGFAGFRDGVYLLKETLDKYWLQAYPNLDPDDGNDPTERLSILRVFASMDERGVVSNMVRDLRTAPLTRSRLAGSFSLKDIAAATLTAAGGAPKAGTSDEGTSGQKADIALIEASAKDSSTEFLERTHKCILEAGELLRAIEGTIDGHVGAGRGIDFKDAIKTLKEAASYSQKFLAFKGIGGAAGAAGGMEDADSTLGATPGDAPMAEGGGSTAGRQGAPISGDIRDRADVTRMLDKICAYYAKVEPSSPVPLLLQRARRLVDKDFWGVIMDLCGEAQGSVSTITGSTPPEPPAS